MSEPMTISDDPKKALLEIAGYLRWINMTPYREVRSGRDSDEEIIGYYQLTDYLQGLLEIADECDRIIDSIPQALVLAEPVAWGKIYIDGHGNRVEALRFQKDEPRGDRWIPLYAAPQDEDLEILTLFDECLEALCCLENLYGEIPDRNDRDWIEDLISRLRNKTGEISYFERK